MGICPAYTNELLELNNSQHSRNTRGAKLTILPRRYIGEKEGGRKFSVTTSRCWNHLHLKLRTSQSAGTVQREGLGGEALAPPPPPQFLARRAFQLQVLLNVSL